MTRAERTQMARLLRGLFQQVEDERLTMLTMLTTLPLHRHEKLAVWCMTNASAQLEQAARYLDEPTPTHERKTNAKKATGSAAAGLTSRKRSGGA